MNWDAVSAVSDTVASIAVIVSLIYVARQIRHSNQLAQSQTRSDLRHMANAEVGLLVEHPEIWLIMWKERLTEEEQARLHSFLIGALRFREFIWRQYHTGFLDRATFEFYTMVIAQLLAPERCRRWWDEHTKMPVFDPEFTAFVRKLLDEHPGLSPRLLIDLL